MNNFTILKMIEYVIKSMKMDSNAPKKVNVLSGGLSTWRKDI